MAEETSLERVLRRLQECEISCGIGTAPPTHISVWIDAGNRIERADFYPLGTGVDRTWAEHDVAVWLHERAMALFPHYVKSQWKYVTRQVANGIRPCVSEPPEE